MIDFNPIMPEDTVFIGDSLTESFDLLHYFNKKEFRNRGVAGSLTDHVIYRMEEVSNASPARIFLMIGINDLFSGQSTSVILENIYRIVEHFLETCPKAEIKVQSILPVNLSKLFEDDDINLKIYEINNQLASYCMNKGIPFLNLHPEFLGMHGEMDMRYTFDGVHLTGEGYTLWSKLLAGEV